MASSPAAARASASEIRSHCDRSVAGLELRSVPGAVIRAILAVFDALKGNLIYGKGITLGPCSASFSVCQAEALALSGESVGGLGPLCIVDALWVMRSVSRTRRLLATKGVTARPDLLALGFA